MYGADAWYLHTHGRLPLLCSLTDLKFLRFQIVKNKARDIRLLNIFWFPRRMRNAFRMAPCGFNATSRRELI